MLDGDAQYLTNPLLDMDVNGPILLTLLEKKEGESVDEMDVGDVIEVEMTEHCDIKIDTSDKVPRKEKIHDMHGGKNR